MLLWHLIFMPGIPLCMVHNPADRKSHASEWDLQLLTSNFRCPQQYLSNTYLVGGLEHGFYDVPYIGNFIIRTDELIFFRGLGATTNQLLLLSRFKIPCLVAPSSSLFLSLSPYWVGTCWNPCLVVKPTCRDLTKDFVIWNCFCTCLRAVLQ